MSVIVELSIPSAEFELGEMLRVEGPTQVTLETMVPLAGRPTPFVRVERDVRSTFAETVSRHPTVDDIHEVTNGGDGTLYALDWTPSEGTLFNYLLGLDVALLNASGGVDRWNFELRFESHELLSTFQSYYIEHDIPVTIERIYNPTRPDAGPWYGLTPRQRQTLVFAVTEGYYSVPRRVSTQAIANEFDVSDQAIVERLRRGIDTLVDNTLLAAEETRE